MSNSNLPMRVYRLLADLSAPIIILYLHLRLLQEKEDKKRLAERFGYASVDRPNNPLIWCHGASVGESLSVLSLIEEIRKDFPNWHVLLTTGTTSSAKLLAKRLPKGVFHQYLPIDRHLYVRRFLDYWRPDLVIFIESELWPNILNELKKRKISTLLLNGRMSEKSFHRWQIMANWARSLLNAFDLVLAQAENDANRFSALGAKNVRCISNLKFAASLLPCDEIALDLLRSQVSTRPIWLMASTHPGEEEIALSVHMRLRSRRSNILTVLVPRHVERSNSITELIKKCGLKYTQRTKNKNIPPDTEIYLADTMGELGLFYRLAPIVCVGGTFTWKGHNPIEPAQLGCAVIFGPNMTNFSSIAEEMLAAQAALQVHSPNELAVQIEQLLDTPEYMFALANAGRALMEKKRGVLKETMKLLTPWLAKATVGA